MVVTSGRTGRRHGDGRRRQATGGSGHHARLFQRLSFLIAHNEVVGDKDVERGAGIFCKIIIVCFLSVRYRSYGLYYKMVGTPSSSTRFL